MTNKEAIYIINNRLNTYYCTDEDLQALDLAIKALEERPKDEIHQERPGGLIMRLIDADKLKEGLRGNFKDVMGNFVFNTTFSQLEAIIDTTPTVSIDNTGYSQGFKDGKECTLVSIDAIEDITDCMVSIISEIDWEKAIEAYKERPHGEWILISERLPDRFEDVLITYQIPNREPKVRRALYVGGKFNFDNGDTWNWNDPEIKAWMPLPEAYKEAEND